MKDNIDEVLDRLRNELLACKSFDSTRLQPVIVVGKKPTEAGLFTEFGRGPVVVWQFVIVAEQDPSTLPLLDATGASVN